MRLKRALSQIRPTEERKEKIYGDILDKLERLDVLDKLSEEPSENKKETRFVMKKRKIFTPAIAALAAVVVVGGTVYAASPEVRETVNNILGINREATQDYYEIFEIENGGSVTNVDIIENALNVTENDFTDFSEGIRAKLVSVVNSGSFAEVLLEFEFDEPVKDGEYSLENLNIDAYPDILHSYSYGALTVSDSGKIYSRVLLRETENIPEDMVMTMEFTTLDKANSQNVHNTDETYADDPSIKINGKFTADFSLGSPIKPMVIEIEPTKISWTHPYMMGAVAKMEMSGIKYSPKYVDVDLRMLNECIVKWRYDGEGGRGYSQYCNNSGMFYHPGGDSLKMLDYETTEDEYIALKFKMSDGTLKTADIMYIESNAVNDIDKNTLITDEDWLKASWDIPSDKPATVTFELAGIMDYTNVEAIVFCGKEIPITEKNF